MVIQKTDPGSGFCLFVFMPISIAVPVRIHHCRRSRGEEIGPIPNGAPTCPCILARECGGFYWVVVTDNGDGECTGALGGLLDPEEGDIDRESCLEYECEHDLDDIDRPWRLNGRRAVTLTIFLLK